MFNAADELQTFPLVLDGATFLNIYYTSKSAQAGWEISNDHSPDVKKEPGSCSASWIPCGHIFNVVAEQRADGGGELVLESEKFCRVVWKDVRPG